MKTILILSIALTCYAQSTRSYLTNQGFSPWRDHGEWTEVGGVELDVDPARLLSVEGERVFVNGSGRTVHLVTEKEYGDMRLHIEFTVPKGSNSGVYFMGRYEIQIRDSYQQKNTYPGNECGGIYQRWDEDRRPKGFEGHSPRIDAARPPGEWQWFEAIFRAPRFENGVKVENARFERVTHNGVIVHENVEVTGPTRAAMFEDEQPTGPLMLQGDHGPVAYRNIWVTDADLNPFFAMDTGTRDEEHVTFDQQIDMLAELGYDGMDHTGVDRIDIKLDVLDQYGLNLYAIYLDAWADEEEQWVNDGLEKVLPLLEHRPTCLWLPIRSNDYQPSDPAGDAGAIALIRRIAEKAAQYDLDIALYPHSFFLLQTVGDAVRLAKKVDRPNVGVTFNLCHWLRTDKRDLEEVLTQAAPYLSMVTINGADHEGDWDRLIQPLDAGEFEVGKVLDLLDALNYKGPIGLQGYGIGGSVHENLQRSMARWGELNSDH